MNGIVGKLLSNPHTTGAGIAFAVIKAARHIALLWTPPQYAHEINGTSEALESVAMAYGLVLAGDAGKAQKDLDQVRQDVAASLQTGNTDRLVKKDLPVPADATKTGI